jgi:hypothetical protein
MAVVSCAESIGGTGLSGKYGETFTFTRKWKIRVDDPATPKVLISRFPGVYFGAPHPEFSDHRAMEFELSDDDGVGMWWLLVVKYYIPPKENTPDDSTGMPKDLWTATGSTTSIPVFQDNGAANSGTKQTLTNSAGDPIEDLEREASDFGLTLTKCYADTAWSALAMTHSNSVNNGTWNAGAARTWKVAFRGATPKEMTVSGSSNSTKKYWETTWEFAYRADTWDLKPWDVGFNQKVDSSGNPSSVGTKRAAVLGADKKPVKQPVALTMGVAKTAGEKPDALTFRVYPEVSFSSFGTPS